MTGRRDPRTARGVDTRDQSLRRGLFVARRAVDLAGEKQAGDPLGFERAIELGRLDEIVFHRIGVPQDRRVLEPRQRMHDRVLHVARQAHRQAVDVDLVDVQAFRLEKDLMPLPVGKAHDLVFERRAVARADAGDLPVVERRPPDARADDLVHRDRSCAAGDRRSAGAPSRPDRNENGTIGSSPCSAGNREKSMLRRSSRGGVPVLSRPISKPQPRSDSASACVGGSPARPAGRCSSPMCTSPFRNVPVVTTSDRARDDVAVLELEPADAAVARRARGRRGGTAR